MLHVLLNFLPGCKVLKKAGLYIPLITAAFLSAAVILLSLSPPLHAQADIISQAFPSRIVSLGPLNTENVFLLGAGNRLVADTVYCVRPQEARHREKIGSLMEINIEKIVSLQPDLVLATALTRPEQVKKLKSLGIRVVSFAKPDSFETICSQFLELGRILGLMENAEEIVTRARMVIECVKGSVSGLSRRKVFLQVGTDPVFASVPGSFTNDYITLGGGINIAADQTTGLFSREKVVAMNPDVIIIAVMGTETGTAAREKKAWKRFSSITAVRDNRVHTLDPDIICSPSPLTFAHALEKTACLIHPEAASVIDRCNMKIQGLQRLLFYSFT